jgi:hypothetical protein
MTTFNAGDQMAEYERLDTPAPEGEVVAWRCSGCRRLTDDLDADRATLDAGGFLSCCPERDMKALYASPVVPVGREEIARIIEPEFFSIGRAGPGYEPHRASAFRKADAILAALGTKATDTGTRA